ncbi:hypothetical protein G9A89_002891 [Geosiphon pyriformis]|nr:hypothetical protein G9A89_002891 [Geosiphon pyriformis]
MFDTKKGFSIVFDLLISCTMSRCCPLIFVIIVEIYPVPAPYQQYTIQKQFENEKPGFICTNGSESSNIENSPSTAINTLYQSIFGVKTEYSGLSILGFNNKALVQKLTKDISFVPLFLKVDKHTIVINSIGCLY